MSPQRLSGDGSGVRRRLPDLVVNAAAWGFKCNRRKSVPGLRLAYEAGYAFPSLRTTSLGVQRRKVNKTHNVWVARSLIAVSTEAIC